MAPVHRMTIVVVDDDDGHVALIRRNLRRAGLDNEIVTLGTGSAALDYVFARGAHAQRPQDRELLLLLDINMPGLDGIEVLRRIKADPVARTIPVIMLTTADDPREVTRCYELGCNVYVTKPVDPEAFVAALHTLGLFIAVVRGPTVGARAP